ncbi:MAG: hypothetical protein Q9216_001384 [Gyalolechia sp. 2 TL-2023]
MAYEWRISRKEQAEIINERQQNLPLPDEPPVASDWNSADPSKVNVGSGGVQSDVSYGGGSDSGLRGPATSDSSLRTDGEQFGINTSAPGKIDPRIAFYTQTPTLQQPWHNVNPISKALQIKDNPLEVRQMAPKSVTTDPQSYQNPTREGAGPIASDSLAAESTRSGGAFAANRGSAPQSVSGSSSTFNTTDTSGARELAPAPDAAEREAKEAWQEVPDEARGTSGQKYPEGAGTVDFAGSHNADGYAGGSVAAQQEVGGSGYTPSGMRGGAAPAGATGGEDTASSKAEAAPGYVASVKSDPAQTGKPHGKNITEGGFESDDSKNASFGAEIGSKDDPGRAATEQFQTTAQTSAGGKGARQGQVTGDGQYDTLETEQNL